MHDELYYHFEFANGGNPALNLRSQFMMVDAWLPLMWDLRFHRAGREHEEEEGGAGSHYDAKAFEKKEGVRMEVDAHGVPRVVENSDHFMDTDVMTPGSIQRQHLEVLAHA